MFEELNNFFLKVKCLKCFGEQEQGFERIKPINLIIGRNNSGKSSLLDLIEYAVKPAEIPRELWHYGKLPQIIAESPLSEAELRVVFNEGTSHGGIPGKNHWEFGKKYLGAKLRWYLNNPLNKRFISISECLDGSRPLEGIAYKDNYYKRLAEAKKNLFSGKEFRRIFAERNIVPEEDGEIKVAGDGTGVSNIIQNFINDANLPRDLVEKSLLQDLNTIYKSDGYFTDIICQKSNNKWEIYIEEESKGLISLSQSGSGFKTIIIILVYMNLIPFITKKNLSEFIFGCEELENNLHPALLRRLLSYLFDKAESQGCIFFLTTHSNVEIDFFNKNPDAQILHVTHDGKEAFCRTVKTYIENKEILDDLDIRASDLLQSNVVIWVEGPSDRIYLNRWISLWADGELEKGNHYQCVFYGGRLLAHLSCEEPDIVDDSVSMLRVNKNSVILIDSDKKAKQRPINQTIKRIIQEIGKINGIHWVTKGKEIENYISAETIKLWLRKEGIKQVEQYENFFNYLDSIEKGLGKKYSNKKPVLAENLIPFMKKEHLSVLDIQDKLIDICDAIRKWNSMNCEIK